MVSQNGASMQDSPYFPLGQGTLVSERTPAKVDIELANVNAVLRKLKADVDDNPEAAEFYRQSSAKRDALIAEKAHMRPAKVQLADARREMEQLEKSEARKIEAAMKLEDEIIEVQAKRHALCLKIKALEAECHESGDAESKASVEKVLRDLSHLAALLPQSSTRC